MQRAASSFSSQTSFQGLKIPESSFGNFLRLQKWKKSRASLLLDPDFFGYLLFNFDFEFHVDGDFLDNEGNRTRQTAIFPLKRRRISRGNLFHGLRLLLYR